MRRRRSTRRGGGAAHVGCNGGFRRARVSSAAQRGSARLELRDSHGPNPYKPASTRSSGAATGVMRVDLPLSLRAIQASYPNEGGLPLGQHLLGKEIGAAQRRTELCRIEKPCPPILPTASCSSRPRGIRSFVTAHPHARLQTLSDAAPSAACMPPVHVATARSAGCDSPDRTGTAVHQHRW